MTRFSDLLGRDDTATEPEADSTVVGDVASAPDFSPADGPEALPVASAPESTIPTGGISRDVFNELASEQAAIADHESDVDARVKELGLDALPAVKDDFLPGR